MEFDLKVTEQDLMVLYQGLGELPLKLAGNVFGKLQTQVQEQESKSNEARAAELIAQ